MVAGRAISLFLIDGIPEGRIACELFNWTGKAFRIPRKLLKESADRTYLRRAGVYFLFGKDDTRNEVVSVYIGQAEEVMRRLTQHQEKDFWTEAVVFISKDENLNRAHIEYLEYLILQKATEAGRYSIQNGNMPSRPTISEVEQAIMTEYFENLQLLTGSLGYKIFEPLVRVNIAQSDEYAILGARGANAKAVFGSEGMVVRKGSEAAGTTAPSTPESVTRLRTRLSDEGVLAPQNGNFVFTRDHLFSSPSAAAGVVLGRSANGWIEWKDQNGHTLKENEQ